MRDKLMSIGDDVWIEDESGAKAFKVDGKAVRLRDTILSRDTSGAEVATNKDHLDSVRDTVEIHRPGGNVTVKKALAGIRDSFSIDVDGGAYMSAHGNVVDHEYEIERDGTTVATVSKKWFRVRDTHGVEVAPGEDVALLLAVTVCIDELSQA